METERASAVGAEVMDLGLPPRTPNRTLALIACFKFVEAALSIAVALGAFGMLDARVAASAERWVVELASGYDARLVERAIAFFAGLRAHRLEVIGAAALVYAALFLAEGIGLWRGRRWAEYLTVVITGSLIPYEIYELARHVTLVRVVVLVGNAAIVAYLILVLRRGRPHVESTVAGVR
jgi:uncharacterized membrane protein (DUF2068 family)